MSEKKEVDIANLRKSYHSTTDVLLESSLTSKEPFAIFQQWLQLAVSTDGVEEPNAMCIATVNKEGRPSARMVLMKGYDQNGFRFFTNQRSRKGQDMSENPNVALVFFWEQLSRSVRVEGQVEMIPDKDVDDYYAQRPRSSQIAAHVSQNQSAPIKDRDVLKDRFVMLEEKYKEVEKIERPEFWRGYNVRPDKIEFWQGQSTRMHDRIVFSKEGGEGWNVGENGWNYQRLEP